MPVSPVPTDATWTSRPDIAETVMEASLSMNMEGMIGGLVMPVYEAKRQGGEFPIIPRSVLFQMAETIRANGGSYNLIGIKYGKGNYSTEDHGLGSPVDKRLAAMVEDYFDAEVETAEIVRNIVLTNYEQRVSDAIMDVVKYVPNGSLATWLSGGVPNSLAKPILDVEARVQSLYSRGIVANAMVMSWNTFRNLRNMQEIIDRVSSNGAGSPTKSEDITPAMLSSVFALPHIIVGKAQKQTANEGQTSSLATIWPQKYVSVCRVARPGARLTEPCIGRTFHWDGAGSKFGGAFDSWVEPNIKGTVVRMCMETDEKYIIDDANELIDTETAA
ncbi:MAG: hypothetical protein JKX85_04230 [Phycisphaeraceae bacterium]|nr:hypothetical protein [Phycisphaeraceae bacterium]